MQIVEMRALKCNYLKHRSPLYNGSGSFYLTDSASLVSVYLCFSCLCAWCECVHVCLWASI